MATLPQPSKQRILDFRKLPIQPSLLFAILFWLFTFALMSGWAALNPDRTPPLQHLRRAYSTTSGAIFFWIMLRVIEARTDRAPRQIVSTALALVVPGAVAVLASRMLFDYVIMGGNIRVTENLRWLILWSGYFLAWLSTALAARFYSRLEALSTKREAPLPVEARQSGPEQASEAPDPEFWVQRQGAAVRLAVSEIERIEAEGNYVRIHSEETAGLIRMSMAYAERMLDPDQFIRVHRSVICRRSSIRALKRKPSGAMLAELQSGAEVPVGRSYAKSLSGIARHS